MKKINLNKHLRFGGYSTLITITLVAILLVINLIFAKFNFKVDLTEEKFYSLSDKTVNILQQLTDPINIYVLEETGKERLDSKEILHQYEDSSHSKVSIIYKDPVLHPSFAQQYIQSHTESNSTLPAGSMIVENTVTGKYKVLPTYELFNLAYDANSEPVIHSVAIEEKITSAIDYVVNSTDYNVYVTSGHGELTLPTALVNELETENFNMESINLLTQEIPASPYNTLLIYSPHLDLVDAEKEKVIAFLESGGKAMIFIDSNMPELPNFNEVLSLYGLSPQTGIIVEGDPDHMVSPYPTFLLPEIQEHEITSAILENKLPIITPLSCALTLNDNIRTSLKLTPLLTTSSNSWLKKNLEATTLEKEAGDLDGPLNIAYLIEDENYLNNQNPISTKLFVMSNTVFLDPTAFDTSSTANLDFVTNGLLWLQDKYESLAIKPKISTSYTLSAIPASTLLIFAGVSVILLPMTFIIFGIIIWQKRRHM